MKIWVSRHGQTNLNRAHLMQGRTDEPLNERGRQQARSAREAMGEVTFDMVYASPLTRAIETAQILSGKTKEDILIDPRIIETDFGKYERRPYWALGPWMSLYWRYAEYLPCPPSVETLSSMKERSRSFLEEIIQKGQEMGSDNILITCHGGIMKALIGYLSQAKHGVIWRPKLKNCEIRVYELDASGCRSIGRILPKSQPEEARD